MSLRFFLSVHRQRVCLVVGLANTKDTKLEFSEKRKVNCYEGEMVVDGRMDAYHSGGSK